MDEAVPSRAEQVHLYLETLRARMDPDQFRVLRHLLDGALLALSGRSGEGEVDLADEDEVYNTPEVQKELLAALAILATGTLEHHIVDLGDGASVVMTPEAANDPEAVQRMREFVAKQRAEREHTDAVLRGIADASQT
ncbi:hypothetical protein [Kitasatospora sp. HPMI-4]|uniref:hypothetical protein n=1 Tax=Kitasatospora sp. HPMI-4 TaxID=3448443 RepID=UPI003F1E2169